MIRKAAIVLALATTFLGAQAMDLPKPTGRELTNTNHTKPAKADRGVKSKAKTAELCFRRDAFDGGFLVTNVAPGRTNLFQGFVAASVFDCADVKTDGTGLNGSPTAIGVAGMTCAGFPGANNRALCQTEITVNTEWHKTAKTSSIAGSFWADSEKLVVSPLGNGVLTLASAVVTGTTGAWGNAENIQSISLAQINSSKAFYKLTIGYKGRGWNPAAL